MSINRAESWGKTVDGMARWYCVRTQPRHEHIAAATLTRQYQFEVFHPRIKFKRSTFRGAVWCDEPLFPSYIFVKFSFYNHLRTVNYAHGVAGVVHFGEFYPQIPEETIRELRSYVNEDHVYEVVNDFTEGEEVVIGEGIFKGLSVVVLRPMPGSQRVRVLMEFLGRQTEIEMNKSDLVKPSHKYKVEIFRENRCDQ